MGHRHHHHGEDAPLEPAARRALTFMLGPLLVLTLAGLVWLWPTGETPTAADLTADELVWATVVEVTSQPCEGEPPDSASPPCELPRVRLGEGADEGDVVAIGELSPEAGTDLDDGDRIAVARYEDLEGEDAYSFADHDRRRPLQVLALVFAAAVVALGRWTGLRALIAVGVSLLALTAFVLPAILQGESPVAVSLVGASAVAVVAVLFTHGVTARSAAALAGTLVSLVLVAVLAWIFVAATDLTGLADESAGFLRITAGEVDLQGLLLGGVVIGALGVLDDVTVTQVSAVWELHRADPSLSWRRLYASGVRIGRDHIASTVNTLVLAYAGASLPLFLLFTQAQQGLVDSLNSEVVAVEVVRTLVGSIGLVASVPLTTALAALVVTGGSLRGSGRPDRG